MAVKHHGQRMSWQSQTRGSSVWPPSLVPSGVLPVKLRLLMKSSMWTYFGSTWELFINNFAFENFFYYGLSLSKVLSNHLVLQFGSALAFVLSLNIPSLCFHSFIRCVVYNMSCRLNSRNLPMSQSRCPKSFPIANLDKELIFQILNKVISF